VAFDPEDPVEPRPDPQSVLRENMQDTARLDEIRQTSTWADIIEGQLQHIGIAILMVVGGFALLTHPPDAPRLLGLSAAGWGQISIVLALIHQIVVAVVFRLQLHRNMMTRLFQGRDMHVWATIFMPLLVLRPVTVFLTGWADQPNLLGFRFVELILGLALIVIAVSAMVSVVVHFTLPRAMGGDHFRDEIAAMPLVDKGIFAITPNAMYGIVFLGLWGIAFLFGSWNAVVVALFQHAYIWVHMYCTETPDMDWIYGDRLARRAGSGAS
jgi:hypothetical protein